MTCFVSKPSRITLVELSITNTSYQKLHFGGRRRCGKGAKRLQAVLDAPRRNASCEVDRFEVAQGMDPMCTQNPWAITVSLCTAVPGTAVAPFFSSTHVSEGARPTQGLIIVSRVRTRAWLDCSTWDKAPL